MPSLSTCPHTSPAVPMALLTHHKCQFLYWYSPLNCVIPEGGDFILGLLITLAQGSGTEKMLKKYYIHGSVNLGQLDVVSTTGFRQSCQRSPVPSAFWMSLIQWVTSTGYRVDIYLFHKWTTVWIIYLNDKVMDQVLLIYFSFECTVFSEIEMYLFTRD